MCHLILENISVFSPLLLLITNGFKQLSLNSPYCLNKEHSLVACQSVTEDDGLDAAVSDSLSWICDTLQ